MFRVLKFLLPGIFLLISFFVDAQKTSIETKGDTMQGVDINKHRPRTATLMSMAVPGLGQIYNKKYWKLPIIYSGLGTSVYFILWNRKNYLDYRQAYINKIDDDPSTIDTYPYNSSTEIFEYVEYYHKFMEISYIATAGIYILNIIDANVDAHLFYFNVSDDLTLHVTPALKSDVNGQNIPAISFTLKL